MMFLAGDVETYYKGLPRDKEKYSLRTMGTEEYILDRRFQVHGWALSVNGAKSNWYDHYEATKFFDGIDWDKTLFCAHNAMFDGAILAWVYGHQPIMYADTMGIAHRFIRPYTGSSSLDSCARYLGLPLKSGALKEVNGLRTEQIRERQYLWDQLAAYACQDNDNDWYIFKKYWPTMSNIERIRLDWSTRNYVNPKLRINMTALQAAYNASVKERNDLLADAGLTDPAMVRSTKKFAEYLEFLGVEVEYKNGKNDAEIPAVAKNDPFVRSLLHHSDDRVVKATKARLAFSSTIEVTRAERLLKMGHATGGLMVLPTVYHAAHTGRPGGTDGVNPTNFKKGSPVKEAIETEDGYVVVDTDASQIEARICCWLAGCDTLLDAFADPDRDPYCEYASQIFGFTVIKGEHDTERQVGKVGVLSMQYGVGGKKTQVRLEASNIIVTLSEATEYVEIYRESYPEILENGREFQILLMDCVRLDQEIEWKGCLLTPGGIQLPSDRWLYYDGMQIQGRDLVYWSHRYKSWQKLYPGSINENLCQAMANDHVGAVQAKYAKDCINMLYDSVVRVVPAEDAGQAAKETVRAMSVPPAWTLKVRDDRPLPLAAEAKVRRHW